MTLDEAIKLIQEDIDDKSIDWDTPLGEAYKMSFEALKRVKDTRKRSVYAIRAPLPGETDK